MRLKSIQTFAAGILIVFSLTFCIGLLVPTNTYAGTPAEGLQSGANSTTNGDTKTDIKVIIKNISNTALFVLGAIAVLMLIYGGIRYTTSGGDEKAITTAKNIILYAVVGIVVAILAYAIVNFVVGQFVTSTPADTVQNPDQISSTTNPVIADSSTAKIIQYPSSQNVATAAYATVNVLSQQFLDTPAPQELLPSYGPSDITPEAAPAEEPVDTTISEQPSSAEIDTIANETAASISELSAKEAQPSLLKMRQYRMIQYATDESKGKNGDTSETPSDNNGPRIHDYQNYAGTSHCYGKAWCAAFVSYIHHEATGNDDLRTCSVSEMMSLASGVGTFKHYGQPEVGDILTWYGDATKDGIPGHTGILIKINSNGQYVTIEGNAIMPGQSSDARTKVQAHTRNAGYWRLGKLTGATGVRTGFIEP